MLAVILPKNREMDNKLSTEAGEAITPVFTAAAALSPVNPISVPAPASTASPSSLEQKESEFKEIIQA